MTDQIIDLRQLRAENPEVADELARTLWDRLAQEDPKMFHALWAKAHRGASYELARA